MSASTNTILFPGFELPQQNWCKMPLALINNMHLIDTLAEMKVIYYILGHTWAYQEYDENKRITLDEFEKGRKRKDGTRIDGGTGMSRPAILRGLKAAEAHGFIEIDTNENDKARIKKSYKLKMKHDQGLHNVTPDVTKRYPGGDDSLHRSEKDTLDRNPSNGAKKSRTRRPAAELNPIKDAIVAAFGWSWETMTKGEKGKVQAAARDLYDAGRTAEDIPALHTYCKKNYTHFGPTALCNAASEVAKKQAALKVLMMPTEVTLPEPSDYFNIAGVVS